MPRIPLEDNFTDVIGKAQRGLKLNDTDLAAKAGISAADLAAVQGGEIRELVLLAVAPALGLERNALIVVSPVTVTLIVLVRSPGANVNVPDVEV